MTAAKPWYDKSNEANPGVPRSRAPEYSTDLFTEGGARKFLQKLWRRIDELLAVIDGVEEQKKDFAVALDDANAVICRREKQLAAAEEEIGRLKEERANLSPEALEAQLEEDRRQLYKDLVTQSAEKDPLLELAKEERRKEEEQRKADYLEREEARRKLEKR